MSKGQEVVNVAITQIGYAEEKGNKTKYGQWFGMDGVAWCAMFVSWCYNKASKPLGNLGYLKGFAGCQSGHEYFKKKGWITKKPQPGDIVLFDFNGDGRFDHTGIYESKIDEDTFLSIEGNTSTKNQANGGMVMRRERSIKNCVFAHPTVLDV